MINKSKMAAAVAPAVMIGLLSASQAGAGIVFGGTGKSDCYAAINVDGIDANSSRVQKNKKVLCTDGEACDTGACGDGVCNMRVAACINQPGLSRCTPPAGLQRFKVKGKLNIGVPQVLEGSACGSFLDVTVATKKTKKKVKPGKAKFKVQAKALKGTKPATDNDTFELQCLPRTVECPPPTTTTTTTTSTSTIPAVTTTTPTSTTTSTTIVSNCAGGTPNGTVEQGEECDDGNLDDRDGCTLACTICGNSTIVEPDTCDDGNLVNEDFCPNNCRVDFCEPSTNQLAVRVQANRGDLSAVEWILDYPEGQVTLQGLGGNIPAGIITGPPGTSATVQGFDYDHLLKMVEFDAFDFGTATLATINFNTCVGAPPPQPQDFTCRVDVASQEDGMGGFVAVPGVTCSVVVQ